VVRSNPPGLRRVLGNAGETTHHLAMEMVREVVVIVEPTPGTIGPSRFAPTDVR
jgi:hypothetical protein